MQISFFSFIIIKAYLFIFSIGAFNQKKNLLYKNREWMRMNHSSNLLTIKPKRCNEFIDYKFLYGRMYYFMVLLDYCVTMLRYIRIFNRFFEHYFGFSFYFIWLTLRTTLTLKSRPFRFAIPKNVPGIISRIKFRLKSKYSNDAKAWRSASFIVWNV